MTPVALQDVDPEESLSDAELTALALAADPTAPIAEGAVPIGIHLASIGFGPAALVHAPAAGASGWSALEAPFVIAVVSGILAHRSHGTLQHLRDPELGLTARGVPDARQGFPAAIQLLTRASLIRRAVGMLAQARKRCFSSLPNWE